MNSLIRSTALAFGLFATAAHAGSLSVSNLKGFDSNPIVASDGSLLTGNDPVIVVIGTFSSAPMSAIAASEVTVASEAYASLLAEFTPYGAPVGLVQSAAPLNLRGVFSFQDNKLVAGSPLAGKPIYVVIARGSDLNTATQVAILRTDSWFESADDESPFPKLVGMGTPLGTVPIIGSGQRFTASATDLGPTPRAAYSLAAISRSGVVVLPPTVTTGAATELSASSATLHGSVSPNGSPTTARFEYGLSASYGGLISVSLGPDDGSGTQAVSASIGGLQEGQTYHYRLTAINGGGTSPGADMTFVTTLPVARIAVEQPAGSDITDGSNQNFGNLLVGTLKTRTFIIKNTGTADLTGISLNLTGTHASHYYVSAAPATSVNPGGSTSFTLAFLPGSSGPKSASLHIVSNLVGETNPFDLGLLGVGITALPVSYVTGTEVPVTTNSFSATGKTVNFALNHAPATGTSLTVVNNTGIGFINGRFGNLPQGQTVSLSYANINYNFVANYFGGSGNDLVLQWAGTRLLAWGANSAGTLGNGAMSGSDVPVPVNMTGALFGKTITALACAETHSLALCSDGTLAAWGANSSGQLGDNTRTAHQMPGLVNASLGSALVGKTVVAIAAGYEFSVALCSDGSVVAWGSNVTGQLGDNSTTDRLLPVFVDTSAGSALAGKSVVSISAGYDFCLALCSDGQVVAWGTNEYGQLGNNSTTGSSVPVEVSASGALSGKAVAAVAAGHYHSLALCTDGALAGWGDNTFGELGDSSEDSSLIPVAVSNSSVLSGKTPISIGAGQFHSMAVCSDGTLATWGDNATGQLGLTGMDYSRVPVAATMSGILSGRTVVALATGQKHNLAQLKDGSLAAWGENNLAQLGNGSTDNSFLPVSVSPVALAAGERIMKLASGPTASHSISMVAIPLAALAGPFVTSNPPTDVKKFEAILEGLANPNGLDTTASFEYGLTTSYGIQTPSQPLGSGSATVKVTAKLTDLDPNTVYHFRIKAVNSSGTAFGEDITFITEPDPPTAVSAAPTGVTSTTASFIGAVNPNDRPTTVYFEFGSTPLYGETTPPQILPKGKSVREVPAPIGGLTPNAAYHYRVVAANSGGLAKGSDIYFQTSSVGIPTALPSVTTGATTGITPTVATLQGTVNPNGGITNGYFEYGTSTSYGSFSSNLGAGSGNTPSSIFTGITGLVPGTLYHYRLVAENGLGLTHGTDATFTTLFLPPTAVTGGSEPISTTSVQVSGTARAHHASTQVSFEYGIDGVSFPNSVTAVPATVTGDVATAVSAELPNLRQIKYYYRVRAESIGGTIRSEPAFFQVAIISGLAQEFSQPPPMAAGKVTVTCAPGGIVSGWRFVGEQRWRDSGAQAIGLENGDRQVEFRPVPGYIQPPREPVVVDSTQQNVGFEGYYYETPASGTGGISIILKPDAIAAEEVPSAQRAQWRFLGESDLNWRDSGTSVSGLPPGTYYIESKAIAGRTTPPSASVIFKAGETTLTTITYYLTDLQTGTLPTALSFLTTSGDQTKPYAYVGQLQSEVGSSSGFVVKPRVVATAGHVVFDDWTLSAVLGLQWLLQRDAGTFEPKPHIPRGFYSFDGYAAQRISDRTPGSSSPQSQNLDAAAIYFNEEAGRGGYGGFLASDLDNNEFLLSSAQKMLVGYPVDGIAIPNQGRMHASPPTNIPFAKAYGHTYTTSDVRSSGGASGGPLCIQHQNGFWYPAAIYLGGSGQTVVRSIDSLLIELFNRAETSSTGGANNTGGGITHSSVTGILNPTKNGALRVLIEPVAARSNGAGWRLRPDTIFRSSYDQSNNLVQKSGLAPGSYMLELATVPGFQPPTSQAVTITGGQVKTVVFSYAGDLPPLEIWRGENFGTLLNTGSAADTADPDGDGQLNLAEFAAGTNPNSAEDVFKVLTFTKTGTGYAVTAAGKAGRRYVLERGNSLIGGSWIAIGTAGPLAADEPVTLSDSTAPPSQAFYRLRVTTP